MESSWIALDLAFQRLMALNCPPDGGRQDGTLVFHFLLISPSSLRKKANLVIPNGVRGVRNPSFPWPFGEERFLAPLGMKQKGLFPHSARRRDLKPGTRVSGLILTCVWLR